MKVTSRTIAVLSTASATLLLGALLAGCSSGGDDDAPSADATTSSSPSPSDTASPGASSSTASTDPVSENWDRIVDFATAIADGDNSAAATMVVPGSPAARYVTHQQLVAQAWAESESDAPPRPSVTVADDPASLEVRLTPDGSPTTVWRDFAVDADGAVKSWSADSGPVAQSLWKRDSRVTNQGGSFELRSAYRTGAGVLVVVVEIKAGGRSLEAYTPTYVDQAGHEHKATAWSFSDILPAGKSVLAVYVFDDTELGGTLRYEMYPERGPQTVELPVR